MCVEAIYANDVPLPALDMQLALGEGTAAALAALEGPWPQTFLATSPELRNSACSKHNSAYHCRRRSPNT